MREPEYAALCLLAEARGDAVIAVYDEHVAGALVCEDAPLRVYIVLVGGVLVEMVRRDVRDDGDVRPDIDAVQLEARELEHGRVPGEYVRYLAEEGLAYVAAQVDAHARGLQELGDN